MTQEKMSMQDINLSKENDLILKLDFSMGKKSQNEIQTFSPPMEDNKKIKTELMTSS